MAPGGLRPGYWGAPTSTVDWCEQNYVNSYLCAEFWNSLSSLAMVTVGVAGAVSAWRRAGGEWRFVLAYAAVAVVGVGSIAFHTTLQREHQIWDEVPMLWAILVLLHALAVSAAAARARPASAASSGRTPPSPSA